MATSGKNLSEYDKSRLPDASGMRIGLVVSEWNQEITGALARGARQALLDCGVSPDNILRWEVPGSFELPFGCRKMIRSEHPDAVGVDVVAGLQIGDRVDQVVEQLLRLDPLLRGEPPLHRVA